MPGGGVPPPGFFVPPVFLLAAAPVFLLAAPPVFRAPSGVGAGLRRGRRPAREPIVRSCCCLWRRWCSGRRRARPPARLGGLTSFGAAPRSPPVPSGPSGALHTSGAGCVAVLLRGVACGPAGVPGAVWCVGGPGCSMRPWAAARPLTVRAASFARRVVSKLGQASLPPARTAIRPRHRPRTRIGYCDMDRL